MKTKPYTPPPLMPVDPDTVFPVDLPCLMWIGSNEPVGPIPLAVGLLKALELSRVAGASFAIRGEASMKTILTLQNRTVDGERSVVDVFMMQVAVADKFFKNITSPAPSAAAAPGHSAQSGVAEKQPNAPRSPKKPERA